MSTLFLIILPLLAVTQSIDDLFHSFIVLCENEVSQVSKLSQVSQFWNEFSCSPLYAFLGRSVKLVLDRFSYFNRLGCLLD